MSGRSRAEHRDEKLLFVTRNLPPLIGGMERLNWHLLRELRKNIQVIAIGPSVCASQAPPISKFVEVPLRPLWRFLISSTWQSLRSSLRVRPRIIFAGSGLCAIQTWLAARASGATAVAYLHGLDIVVDHAVYRLFWLPILRRMDVIIVNSNSTRRMAENVGIPQSKIHVVHPGTSFPATQPENKSRNESLSFRQQHALTDGPILLSVGRLTKRKGLIEFAAEVLPGVLHEYPNANLVIVGNAPKDALASSSVSPDEVLASTPIELRHSIKFLGDLSDHDLAIAFRAASVHVFPVQEISGDPEGFGMVAIEAAAHGLTTATYGCGGIIDAVAPGVSGYVATPGDAAQFTKNIISLIKEPLPKDGARRFAEGFSWDAFGTKIWITLAQEKDPHSSCRGGACKT